MSEQTINQSMNDRELIDHECDNIRAALQRIANQTNNRRRRYLSERLTTIELIVTDLPRMALYHLINHGKVK